MGEDIQIWGESKVKFRGRVKSSPCPQDICPLQHNLMHWEQQEMPEELLGCKWGELRMTFPGIGRAQWQQPVCSLTASRDIWASSGNHRSEAGTAELTAAGSYWISVLSLKTDIPPALLSQTSSLIALQLNAFTLEDGERKKKKPSEVVFIWWILQITKIKDSDTASSIFPGTLCLMGLICLKHP